MVEKFIIFAHFIEVLVINHVLTYLSTRLSLTLPLGEKGLLTFKGR
jgi:hypothetical protein